MSEQQEAVAKALASAFGNVNHARLFAFQRDATAAIEALREKALENWAQVGEAAEIFAYCSPQNEVAFYEALAGVINAILGPPSEMEREEG